MFKKYRYADPKNKTIYRLVYGGRIYYPSTVGTNATTGNECLTTHSRNRKKLKKIAKYEYEITSSTPITK